MRLLLVAIIVLCASPALAASARLSQQATLRATASATAEELATLKAGTTVDVIRCRDDWCRVRTDAGLKGWIMVTFTTNGADNDSFTASSADNDR